MNKDTLQKAKEICDKQFNNDVLKNWDIQEFTPSHAYNYMFMSVYMKLFKQKMYNEGVEN